jgi:hypothetical protein
MFVFLFSFVTKQYTEVRRYVLVPGFRLFRFDFFVKKCFYIVMRTAVKQLVFIEGLDGAGKSTTAQQAAQDLSQSYPTSRIHVTDSTGLYAFRNGELTSHRFERLPNLEPHRSMSPVNAAAHLIGFTLGRRFIDGQVAGTDLHISVRDSHRIEPAVYASVYGFSAFGRISPERRLSLLDVLTCSPYANSVIHLQANPNDIEQTMTTNGNVMNDPHETREKLDIVAHELPRVIGAYERLYGARVDEIEALTAKTTDEVAAALEPLLSPARF